MKVAWKGNSLFFGSFLEESLTLTALKSVIRNRLEFDVAVGAYVERRDA